MRFPILNSPLAKNKFSLDSSGIAGFFGGEESFAAMNSVHLIPGRRWMGWYNSPGSYFVAKKYGILPDSTFWDGLFPGPTVTPAKLVALDANPGPRYTGVYSGTQLATTGHLSYLVARYCEHLQVTGTNPPKQSDDTATAKPNNPNHPPAPEKHRDITVTVVNFDFADIDEREWKAKVDERHFKPIPPLGIIGIMATILFSCASSVLAALYGDWFSFSMILYGAFANGITLLVLGTGDLCLDLTKPSPESPPGDGIIWDSKKIILVLGKERIISTILHSGYRLEYSNDLKYQKIGFCSILLLVQFLLQLFLIPQGILVGQILFLSTLAMSWICNGYLASFDREEMQSDLLFKIIGTPKCYKLTYDKWSAAVAFTMSYFDFTDAEPEGIINELIPNNTPSWNLWKECICAAIKSERCDPSSLIEASPSDDGVTNPDRPPNSFREKFDKLPKDKDRTFVKTFLEQADGAFDDVDHVKAELKEAINGSEAPHPSGEPQQTGEGASDRRDDTQAVNHSYTMV